MPVKFKVIEKGQPGVAGGGEKKFYASANITGEKTLAGLTKDIEKISTVSGADIRAVLYALVDVMQELGSLRVNISSEGKATEKEVTAAAIRGAKVVFSPGADLKTMLATLKYEKI
jgi:hypothetical protein